MTNLILGGAGFIGHHLARRLVNKGEIVTVDDIASTADWPETPCADLQFADAATWELHDLLTDGQYGVAYQLAADMGGMGFIADNDVACMTHNVDINLNVARMCAECGPRRVFFSSSACVYPDMAVGGMDFDEDDAFPALPDNGYGWEKLYSELMYRAYHEAGLLDVTIARFQNCYGPECTWTGGREKAPAAICRKVAMAPRHGTIEVWGDGSAERNYIYIDDLIDGVLALMASPDRGPVNIGTDDKITVDELVDLVSKVAGKPVHVRYVDGPVGVQARNLSNARLKALGWTPHVSLTEGLARTYEWVAQRVAKAGAY